MTEMKLVSNISSGLILVPNLQRAILTTLSVFRAFWIPELWVKDYEADFHLKNVNIEGWQDYLAWTFIKYCLLQSHCEVRHTEF